MSATLARDRHHGDALDTEDAAEVLTPRTFNRQGAIGVRHVEKCRDATTMLGQLTSREIRNHGIRGVFSSSPTVWRVARPATADKLPFTDHLSP